MTNGAGSVSHRDPNRAGLPRQLAALCYDLLLIAAVLMIVTWLLLPLTHGKAITRESVGAFEYLYRALLLALIVVYYGLSWTRSGETVGMLAWRIRVVRVDGSALRWRDVLARLLAAVVSWLPLGLGYLWALADREHLTWHDRLSRTRVIRTRLSAPAVA